MLSNVNVKSNFNKNSDLELVANADEAEFSGLLFGVLVGDWVLK